MNLNWVILAINAWLVLAILVMVVRIRGIRQEQKQSHTKIAELRSLLESVCSEVAELKTKAPVAAAMPTPTTVPASPAILTADQRAAALELLRSGMDSATVSARLQLSPSATALLERVQNMLGPIATR